MQQLQALPGLGVQAEIGGRRWLLGNLRLMREQGLVDAALEDTLAQHERQGRSVTLLADGQGVRALFAVADPLRARRARPWSSCVRWACTRWCSAATTTAQAIAAEAGVEDARGGLLPQDKLDALAALQRSRPHGHGGRRHQRRPGPGPGRPGLRHGRRAQHGHGHGDGRHRADE
ncbi:heavy metal translocating P-type ATPase [Alicycliphilus sp. B1]|nr:heavy metal translocating P-type ATPase [Alicycliphilus sp. B1]